MAKQKLNEKFIDIEKVLNEKELKYFKMIYPRSGVPYLYSEPGIAKSAIQRSIAKKLNLYYIDIRLSMMDETDVGLYPNKREFEVIVNGEVQKKEFLDHIVPLWAHLANNPPVGYVGTLIHFEELNRAQLAVRNASLQILLEKCIGYDFKFNENVYMVSTGNLGEEDGTDVEEFDSALNGRLIHYRHTLTLAEWIEYYAKDNIQPSIIRYLEAHPDQYYVHKHNDKDKTYASPRAWTFLSDFVTEVYGFGTPIKDWIQDIQTFGHSYIGSANTVFLRYLRDALKIGILDIINKYPEIKKEGIIFNRDKKSELLSDLKAYNNEELFKLKPNQIENIKLFVLDLEKDETASYLLKILDDDYNFVDDNEANEKQNKQVIEFLRDKRFEPYRKQIASFLNNESEDDKSESSGKKKK